MRDELKYQLRLTLRDPFADAGRSHPNDPSIAVLTQVLQRHDAILKCQHDAFADYVREAEANGVENYPLYDLTKQTVEIKPLVGGEIVAQMFRYDTDPAHNPQPPRARNS